MINCVVGTEASKLVWPARVDQSTRLINPQDIGLKNTGEPLNYIRPPEYVMDAMTEWSSSNDARAALVGRIKAAINAIVWECKKQNKTRIVVDVEAMVPTGDANLWGWNLSDSEKLMFRRAAMGLLPMVLGWAKQVNPRMSFTVFNLPMASVHTIISNEPTGGAFTSHLDVRRAWYDACNLEARPLVSVCSALTPCCYLWEGLRDWNEHQRYCREMMSYCRQLYPGKPILPFITLNDPDFSKELIAELKAGGAADVCVWYSVNTEGEVAKVQKWIEKVC